MNVKLTTIILVLTIVARHWRLDPAAHGNTLSHITVHITDLSHLLSLYNQILILSQSMDIKPRLNTILCCCINKLSRLVHPCPSQQFLIKLTTLNILLDWNNWWRRLTFIYSSAWRLLEPNNYLLSHLFKGLTSTDWSIVQLVLWWGQFEMLYSVLNCTKQGHETHVTISAQWWW